MPPNNEFTATNPNTVPQPQTVNMILASLGGPYTPQGGGNTSPTQQGWVPPQSRDDLPSKVSLDTSNKIQSLLAANTYRFLAKMLRAVEDCSILVLGDSTGNETVEWVRLWLGSFAKLFPTHTVTYHLWDSGDTGYDIGAAPAAEVLQTGTAGRALNLWNFSIAGAGTRWAQGVRWATAIAPTNPDLIIISYGHNEGATVASAPNWRWQYLALTEALTAEFPQAAVTCILQNPATANTDQQSRATVYQAIAAERGFGIINVQKAFLDTNTPATYIKVDGIHPTTSQDAPATNGSQLWADTVSRATDPTLLPSMLNTPINTQQPSSITNPGEQILPNGNFSAFSLSVPDNWTATACTTVKDQRAGWFESKNGWAVRVQASSAAQSFIQQDIASFAAYKGQWVTLLVRCRVAAAQASTVGRIGINDGIQSSALTTNTVFNRDGFFWQMVSFKVATNASRLRIILYGDSAANASADVTYDSAFLVLGMLPRRAIG